MPDEGGTSRGKPESRRVLERLLAFVGAAALIIGSIVGVVWFGNYTFNRGESPTPSSDPWIAGKGSRELSRGEVLKGLVVADSLTLQDGAVELEPATVLVVDSIKMGPGASLKGSNAVVVARSISGGRLDFGGTPGSSLGEVGSNGGTVTIVTTNPAGFLVDITGGIGARGLAGERGKDGRNGNCDPFGRYRGAEPGFPGRTGGTGGDGGDAGSATYLVSALGTPNVSADGGAPGGGGPGGPGGYGGRGCVGLGGSQSSAPSGPAGQAGQSGKAGSRAQPICKVVPEVELRGAAKSLVQPGTNVQAELQRLASATRGSCGK